MKNLIYLLFTLIIVNSSCKKESNTIEKPKIDNRLIGTWRIQSYQEEENGSWDYHEPDEYMQLFADGTGKSLYVYHYSPENNNIKTFKYSVENNIITFTNFNHSDTERIISIIDDILTTRVNEATEVFSQLRRSKVDGDIEDYLPKPD